jgi:hypothetical protein
MIAGLVGGAGESDTTDSPAPGTISGVREHAAASPAHVGALVVADDQ